MTDDDIRLALVVTWAINTVECDECAAIRGDLCTNGFTHPARVTKALFADMTEEMAR